MVALLSQWEHTGMGRCKTLGMKHIQTFKLKKMYKQTGEIVMVCANQNRMCVGEAGNAISLLRRPSD